MKTYSISKLARVFGLSRSTLLYYDKIGLLSASDRTGSNYRVYTEKDRRRLEKICKFREAGLPIEEIRHMLTGSGNPFATILKQRLQEISGQIVDLKQQQRLLAAMLRGAGENPSVVDKSLWVKMLREAGMNEQGMARWHSEFERRSPDGHDEFLGLLGIPAKEIQKIREWAAGM